jgi:hypothetical protein
MATVTDSILAVLRDSRLGASTPEGGWMRRSKIVESIYGEGTPVNAHHRSILKTLVHCGEVQERHRNNGFAGWYEYRDAR